MVLRRCFGALTYSTEHKEHLKVVLDAFKREQLYLNPKKCAFSKDKIEYLGYTVEEERVKPSPERVQAIQEYATPTTTSELRRFLGLANFVGHLVANFSLIARPLHELLEGKPAKNARLSRWTATEELAFEDVKKAISQTTGLYF